MATLIQFLQNTLASKDARLPVQTKRIFLKEALQALVLDFLYNHNRYRLLTLYGGTCLRVVYGLNRLSEDIDMDNQQGLDLSQISDELSGYFRQTFDLQAMSIKEQRSPQGIARYTLKFPVLQSLGLAQASDEALHLKVEISHHRQVAVVRKTPILYYSRSFVPAHFSLETMMAAKMIACMERSFIAGRSGAMIKGRDFYDLLWFMQQRIEPLEEKLARDGAHPYTTISAFEALQQKVSQITVADLKVDLLPLFEQPVFIEQWLESFHDNFKEWVKHYLK